MDLQTFIEKTKLEGAKRALLEFIDNRLREAQMACEKGSAEQCANFSGSVSVIRLRLSEAEAAFFALKRLERDGLALVDQEAVINNMVDKFLAMRLPEDFAPDGGITFAPLSHHLTAWPTGTNLFTADQVRCIFERILSGDEHL